MSSFAVHKVVTEVLINGSWLLDPVKAYWLHKSVPVVLFSINIPILFDEAAISVNPPVPLK